jgi:hypothetical protein
MSAATDLDHENPEQLVEAWREAKRREQTAEAERVLIGNKLASILGVPEEGAKSHTVGNYSVTVKQPINRTVDWAVFDAAKAVAPEGTHMPEKVKRELDETGLKWIRDNQPELYAEIAKAVTAKPGRIGIEVKEKV